MKFCPHCGARQEGESAFCPNCGERLAARQRRRRRRGNYSVTGAVLAMLGGGFLFGPWWPTDFGKISIWQAHDLCSNLLGAIAPSGCSNVTMFWAAALGTLGLGVLVIVGNLFQSGEEPIRDNRPRATRAIAKASVPVTTTESPVPGVTHPTTLEPEIAAPVPQAEASLGGGWPMQTLGIALVVVAVVIAFVAISVTAGGSNPAATAVPRSGAPSATATLSPTALAAVTVDIPVIACATTYGTDEVQLPTESSERMTVPARSADRLAVFATNVNRVLAPRYWRCVASVGANGSAGQTVSAGIEGDEGAIIVEDAASSYGYVLDLTCPLFPEAARLNKADFGVDCTMPPETETVERVGTTVARFMDGPGTKGTGTQSGGSYSAIGAAWFIAGEYFSGAKITCLLSLDDQDLCGLIIDDWLGRSGQPAQ